MRSAERALPEEAAPLAHEKSQHAAEKHDDAQKAI
jgi:hypothetical protein